jgi:hypothetical protein
MSELEWDLFKQFDGIEISAPLNTEHSQLVEADIGEHPNDNHQHVTLNIEDGEQKIQAVFEMKVDE